MSQLRAITKSISKKDNVRLYMIKDSPILYVQILNSNQSSNTGTGMGPATIIRLQPFIKNEVIPVPEYYSDKNVMPNLRIPTVQLSKTCMQMCTVKSNYVYLSGFKNGMHIEGMMDGDQLTRIESYGDVSGKPICKVKIKIDKIKNLSKFNNLCPTGVTKFRFGQDLDPPIMLEGNIGTYGRIRVYLRESNEVAKKN